MLDPSVRKLPTTIESASSVCASLSELAREGWNAAGRPEMVEGVETVRAAHRREAGRGKAIAQNLRRSLANPLQAGLAAAVVKRQHQQNLPSTCVGHPLAWLGACLCMGVQAREDPGISASPITARTAHPMDLRIDE
jgi:hypothetical protein